MLVSDPSFETTPAHCCGASQAGGILAPGAGKPIRARPDERSSLSAALPDSAPRHLVDISPPDNVRRHMAAGENIAIEIIQSMGYDRTEHRFCATQHLLVVCEQGVRQEARPSLETCRHQIAQSDPQAHFHPGRLRLP